MHVIITRPIEDSLELIRNLKIINHVITYLPLINIKGISNKNINFDNCKGIIFTSANAIKFLNTKNISKNIHCYCVVDATEKRAKESGFYNAISAGGNVDALIELIIRTFDKKLGKLFYRMQVSKYWVLKIEFPKSFLLKKCYLVLDKG